MKVGYAFVVADLFHVGHLQFLEKAKSHVDILIVGVLTDEATASYKRKPVIPLSERMRIIQALNCVDGVVEQDARDPTQTMKKLLVHIDVLFHGDDWNQIPGRTYIESIGGKLVTLPYYTAQTTTRIIEQIRV